MRQTRAKWEIIFAAIVVGLGLGLDIHYQMSLWTLKPNGLSQMSGRLPYWDFTNLWGGTVMALKGNVSYLFDVDLYRQTLRALLSPDMLDQEWSYPPSMLLFGIPVAVMPILPAYLAWTLGTLLLLFLALGPLRLPLAVRLAVLTAPASCVDVIFGQNGALTVALLMSGLFLAPSRPLMAGVLLGLLSVKPQLGLLVPFCLLASGNYRAILSAGLTVMLLVAVTGLLFGFDVWSLFLARTRPLMTAILEAPYPQGYQVNAMTFFILARSFGLGLAASYAFQALFSAAAVIAVLWLWRSGTMVDHALRVCLTAVLAIVATPYAYTYDTVAVPAVIALLFLKYRSPSVFLLGAAWLHPPFNQPLANSVAPFGILLPAAIVAWALLRIWNDQPPAAAAVPASSTGPVRPGA